MYEIYSFSDLDNLETGTIISSSNRYFKLHEDKEWRLSDKLGLDKIDNNRPISLKHLPFPIKILRKSDYSLEEKLIILTARVEALEKNDKIYS